MIIQVSHEQPLFWVAVCFVIFFILWLSVRLVGPERLEHIPERPVVDFNKIATIQDITSPVDQIQVSVTAVEEDAEQEEGNTTTSTTSTTGRQTVTITKTTPVMVNFVETPKVEETPKNIIEKQWLIPPHIMQLMQNDSGLSSASSSLSSSASAPTSHSFRTKGRRQRTDSKGEKICRQVLETIYDKPFRKCTPDFLRNPETGRLLELDGYNEELKIAFEYNGIQHYKWPNFTNCTADEFIQQHRRDRFKLDQCDLQGVYLITIPYVVPDHLIEKFIRYYLPENVEQRMRQQSVEVEEMQVCL